MGFYFDHPESTEPSQCRCSVACCIYEGKPVTGEDAALKQLIETLSSADWVKDNDLKVRAGGREEERGKAERSK